ncbi:MAG: hypothetical protein QNJ40_12130 [Xanthomonadales bacterium]|nr:hypothetical protein [Xanthomonadales bacterium]
MTRIHFAIVVILVMGCTQVVLAQDWRFTYQGHVTLNGLALDGAVDLRFQAYESATGTNAISSIDELTSTPIEGGIFSVTVDLGPQVIRKDPVWLEISVRPNGSGTYEVLAPRQRFTPAPFAASTAMTAVQSVTSSAIRSQNVTGAELAPGAANSRVLGPGSVNASRLAPGAVRERHFLAAAVQTQHIAPSAVATSRIASGAVAAEHLASNAVSTPELQADSVQSENLGSGSVTREKIALDAVGSVQLANGAIGSGEIADNAVGTAQINSQVQRRIPGCAAGEYIRRIVGETGAECPTDDEGITGFGGPFLFSVSSINGAGTNSVNMSPSNTHLCILSEIDVRDVDNGVEDAFCEIESTGGLWVLKANTFVGFDADAFCEAICFSRSFD